MPARAYMTGAKEMAQKLRGIATRFPRRVEAALYAEAQIEMTESKRRCPVDMSENAPHRGQLRASGRVEQPERRGRVISVALTYGTDYALPVHEILENFHTVGQARYLASVLEESEPFMTQRLAARLKLDDDKG